MQSRIDAQYIIVAPFTGAWIEIAIYEIISGCVYSRTLHGCVD